MTTADKARRTTGIGSLPHHNVDAALELAFRPGLPFLPQIPIRNPWEFMIPQALEGLPGLQAERDGTSALNFDIWSSRAHAHGRRLSEALDSPAAQTDAFELFEPSPSISSSWQPFLWECAERGVTRAKIQLAGPLTCQWSLSFSGKAQRDVAAVQAQIYRQVWARAIAMIRRLKSEGISPVLFLDEPGLYALNVGRHSGSVQAGTAEAVGIQELGLLVHALRREGAEIGIHCCSNAAWESLLALKPDYLSIDVALSLEHLLKAVPPARLADYLKGGGKLSLGIVPTSGHVDAPTLIAGLNESLALAPDLASAILETSLFTPACGFALQSTSDAESAFEILEEVAARITS